MECLPSLPAIGATIRIIKMGKSLKIPYLGELPKSFCKIQCYIHFSVERVYISHQILSVMPEKKTRFALKILHITDEETEAEKGKGSCSCLKSNNRGIKMKAFPFPIPVSHS